MPPRNDARRQLLALFVAAAAVACTDGVPPDAVAPRAASPYGRALATASLSSTTDWDFVALAGGNGNQGNPKSFTIAGSGTVVASASATPEGTNITTKGFEAPPGSEERGLGLCQDIGTGGSCAGDEIGDDFGNGRRPFVTLDFTGLVSGSTVLSITLASVQLDEGYAVSVSSDGSNYVLLASGVGTGAAVFTIPVPADTRFVRCDVGNGAQGNNYVVQSVTTEAPAAPLGKTFTIGPSSMEGAIMIANGDWVNGGYSFKFVSGSHTETNFSVHATVTITGPCTNGGTDTFMLTLNDAVYDVPAGNTNWLPTGDANSVLSWQGSARASGLCGGVGKLNASKGAVFTATVSQNPPSGSLVDFRFKYRDPAAKGKPNTNCLDTSDPNRARADVCGASWSQTVRDP